MRRFTNKLIFIMIDVNQITTPPISEHKRKQELPVFAIPEGFSDESGYLDSLVSEGATRIYGHPLTDKIIDRLNFELEIINDNEYTRYFLIVEDLVRTAREKFNVFVGPGRGSAAGSLVCYCLGITKIDPLKHDLLFERFANPYRNVLPDIDIDFEDNTKEKLIGYLKEKYGDDNVMQIITYRKSKDGMVTGYSIHASGVAIAKDPISCYTPLMEVEGKTVTAYDGHSIEHTGPVKLSIGELNVLTKMHHIIETIKETKNITVDIDNIPTDDACTIQSFSKGNTDDIFMFCTEKIKAMLKIMSFITFNDLTAIYTMYRPGSIKFLPYYIARKNGNQKMVYTLPCMEKHLKETYGTLIYQEQLILLVRQIAGFSKM